jgi:hypothetical protein
MRSKDLSGFGPVGANGPITPVGSTARERVAAFVDEWKRRTNAVRGGLDPHVIAALGMSDGILELLVEDLAALTAEPKLEPKWVDAAVELPPEKTMVLAAFEMDGPGDWRIKTGTRVPGHPDAVENGWLVHGGGWRPTRWMNIPLAPDGRPFYSGVSR